MQVINNITVFDNDKYFLAMLKGYCYANKIAMTEVDFNINGVNDIEKLKPALVIVPLDFLSAANKSIETGLLKQVSVCDQITICVLNKNSTNISAEMSEWVDVIINKPLDIGEIDSYLKKTFLFNNCLSDDKRRGERRTFNDRRYTEFNDKDDDDGYIKSRNSGYQPKTENPVFKDFYLDHRSRCVFLKGYKVDLTPKEFELVELLSTDVDRIFMADEIINHLWPESNRATKSDLYQYMHLLRKKIEKDPNNPQWIMTVKGFGYKLSINNSKKRYQVPLHFALS